MDKTEKVRAGILSMWFFLPLYPFLKCICLKGFLPFLLNFTFNEIFCCLGTLIM